MEIDIYSSFFLQMLLFVLLATVLIISSVSLFIKPAKRTIRASLVEAATGHIIDISQSETSIGRAKSCDIIISDISVSRFHAVLSKRSTGWMLFDTNSTAGIIVNNKKIEKKMRLNDGDNIKLGNSEYIFYSTAVTTRQQIIPKTKRQVQPKQVDRRNASPANKSGVQQKTDNRKKKTTNTNNNTRRHKSE